jgi:hypothetical protein
MNKMSIDLESFIFNEKNKDNLNKNQQSFN